MSGAHEDPDAIVASFFDPPRMAGQSIDGILDRYERFGRLAAEVVRLRRRVDDLLQANNRLVEEKRGERRECQEWIAAFRDLYHRYQRDIAALNQVADTLNLALARAVRQRDEQAKAARHFRTEADRLLSLTGSSGRLQ